MPRLTREIRQHWEAAGSPPIPAPGTDRHDALADARLAYQRWRVAQDRCLAVPAVTARRSTAPRLHRLVA